MKKILLIFNILILFSSTQACRYTVREIGFSDLGVEPYRLYFFTDSSQPAERAETIELIASAALSDANVTASVVKADEDEAHAALRFVLSHREEPLGRAVLASPQGRFLSLPLAGRGESLSESVWSVLELVLSSPTRATIRRHVVERYGVVLLVEGAEKEENQRARRAVEAAIQDIEMTMGQMPKPVERPPVLVTLPFEKKREEKVLLWSLGIDVAEEAEPVAAILYGRARRMGPPVVGPQIDRRNVAALLNLIGADCECGLDRAWMLGQMIPMRWDSRLRRQVVRELGFDADNPMVRAEMAQILSLGPSYSGSGRSVGRGSDVSGYSEAVIDFQTALEIPQVPGSPSPPNSQSSLSPLRLAGLTLAFMSAMLIAIGLYLMRKARRRRV